MNRIDEKSLAEYLLMKGVEIEEVDVVNEIAEDTPDRQKGRPDGPKRIQATGRRTITIQLYDRYFGQGGGRN